MPRGCTAQRHRLERIGAQLDALSPLRVLERGFAVPLAPDGTRAPAARGVRAGAALRPAASPTATCRRASRRPDWPDEQPTLAEELRALEEIVRRLESRTTSISTRRSRCSRRASPGCGAPARRLASAEQSVQSVLEDADGTLRMHACRSLRRRPVSADALLAEARELHRPAARAGGRAARARGVRAGDGEAFAYALRTPGQAGARRRSCSAAYRAAGGTSPGAAGVAAAVEIVHTYSLVHDDLPCMDDDDLRRGRPTMHRQFDVPTATRVGFLLVPVAAQVLAEAAERLGLEPPSLLGRMAASCSRRAASRAWSAGSGSTSRPSAGSSTCPNSSRCTGARPGR